mmetsp:Transcript_17285/g.25724  ORF Transcript_17285/g.25724 Transcript_17285/m.25724 type:complete len:210 (+) Transcript_17285:313-942(+)
MKDACVTIKNGFTQVIHVIVKVFSMLSVWFFVDGTCPLQDLSGAGQKRDKMATNGECDITKARDNMRMHVLVEQGRVERLSEKHQDIFTEWLHFSLDCTAYITNGTNSGHTHFSLIDTAQTSEQKARKRLEIANKLTTNGVGNCAHCHQGIFMNRRSGRTRTKDLEKGKHHVVSKWFDLGFKLLGDGKQNRAQESLNFGTTLFYLGRVD